MRFKPRKEERHWLPNNNKKLIAVFLCRYKHAREMLEKPKKVDDNVKPSIH